MMSSQRTTSIEQFALQPPSLTADFLEREISRVGASLAELKAALAFSSNEYGFDPRAYEALSPRMRRLVDLVAVAGHSLSQKLCDSPQMIAAV